MKCNISKCKEVCSVKKGCKGTFPPIQGIEQLKRTHCTRFDVNRQLQIFRTLQEKIMGSKQVFIYYQIVAELGYTLLESSSFI